MSISEGEMVLLLWGVFGGAAGAAVITGIELVRSKLRKRRENREVAEARKIPAVDISERAIMNYHGVHIWDWVALTDAQRALHRDTYYKAMGI